ncbi:ferredoxin--NADP reductase [Paraburkholderia sacchari]|uniref:ferredoxin--NADP reductase n=1 Tax=Paraburkholderia sacchari TaxID=159450 RepID=UPI00054437A8|nr:ferredoxin--NADP reductase [Paraburkholderia sacchari]NLP64873.1 ferredoxin--NADP reductase [Paraburkholderia sacchari]
MNASAYHSLRVSAVVEETPDAKSFVLEVPAEKSTAFQYRMGQFLTLRLPIDDRNVLRCYSLASSPLEDEPLRITVKRVAGGRASNWLCDNVRAGDQLNVMKPAGIFSPKSLEGDFLMFGGGSGITPLMSIVRSVLSAGNGRICLLYANRDERSIIFREELQSLARRYPSRLQVVHWLDSVQGIPAVEQLANIAQPWRRANCFICGPASFMDAAVQAMESIDADPARVHVERFVSLPDETSEEQAASVVSDDAASLEVKVHLDGVAYTVACGSDETILDAMLRGGVDAPYSCRSGACATCMCVVASGAVRMKRNEVLDDREIEQGWTLACQAVAESEDVVVRFPE